MAQEIEIEYKAMLTAEQFSLLNDSLPFGEHVTNQINHYFETPDFRLKQAKSALRIRQKGRQYMLTLKEPFADAILETHDLLTKDEFSKWIRGEAVSKENIAKQLAKLNIRINELDYYGSLRTERKTFIKDEIEYVLDKSFYNNIVDYELEIESLTHAAGNAAIEAIKLKYNIQTSQSDPKIKRFFNSLKEK